MSARKSAVYYEVNVMEKVTIEISTRWGRLVRSPFMLIIAALQGVSISFAPLLLYWSGKGEFYPDSQWLVPVLFAIAYLVPLFYFFIGGPVVNELSAVNKKDLN